MQLEQMLGAERAAHKSDIEIARRISDVELSEHRPERRPGPPSGTKSVLLLDGCGNVMEGRYDRLKRLNTRRSIDRFGQGLQHFGVDAGVVVVGIALVLPQTD